MNLNKIIKNIVFINLSECSLDITQQIRSIRNETKIRKNMVNNGIILKNEHKNWVKKINSSEKNFFYAVKYLDKIVGGLGLKNYDRKKKVAEWSFYVSTQKNFIGLGAALEMKAINYFFETYKLKKLYCYVFKHNLYVIKLHKKFGFTEITYNDYNEVISLPKNLLNTQHFFLDKKSWLKIKKIIYNKYINDKN